MANKGHDLSYLFSDKSVLALYKKFCDQQSDCDACPLAGSYHPSTGCTALTYVKYLQQEDFSFKVEPLLSRIEKLESQLTAAKNDTKSLANPQPVDTQTEYLQFCRKRNSCSGCPLWYWSSSACNAETYQKWKEETEGATPEISSASK